MIGIKLEGDTEYLDTYEDTEIELQLDNPLLGNADKLSPGSFTIPFNLPGGEASPKNAGKLNNPDVVANVETYTKQKAVLFYADIPYKSGTLKARSSDQRQAINSNFFFGLNAIREDFKSARLRDVIAENIVIDAADRTREVYLKYNGAGPVTVIVNGKSYTAATLLEVCSFINADAQTSLDSNLFVPYAQYFTSGTTPTAGFAQPFAKIWLRKYYSFYDPFTMLTLLLWEENIDPLEAFTVTVPDEELGDFNFDTFNLTAYYTAFSDFLDGYLTGIYPTDKFRFPTIFNANLHDGKLYKEGEIINAFNNGGMVRNDAAQAKGNNSIQPFLRLKWVLDKIATTFGFSIEGSYYDTVGERLIDNSVTLDVPQIYLYNNVFLFWRRSFNLSELVPDITVVEFLKQLCIRYNAGMYFNDLTAKVTMSLREPIATGIVYEDVTALSGPIESNEDLRVTGYFIRVPKEDGDALSVEEFKIIGAFEEIIEIKCGRLHGISSAISGGFTIGPRTSRKNGEKFGLRIFYYKGIVDNGVNEYPQADISASDADYEGLNDTIFAQVGIYTNYHNYWLLFQQNRLSIKLKVNWPLRSLLQFDWELKRRFDRVNFIVKSFKVKFSNKSASVSDVELYTMK